MTEIKKRAKNAPKTPEALERQKKHWFGQPEANPHISNNSMRNFYRWVESVATMQELRDYIADKANPYVRRRFIQCFMKCEKVSDFFELTNQTHGYPKSEVQAVQRVEIELTHDVAPVDNDNDNDNDKIE